MPFHHCSIRGADGAEIAKDVTVSLQDAGPEWHGTIKVTHLIDLVAGQRYQLILDDGRTGEFMVRRNTFAGDVNRAVAIHGIGPLQS
jgi:hypothetical protein